MRQKGIFRNWKFMICDKMEYSGISKFEPKTSYRTCKFMMCDKMEYSEIENLWYATKWNIQAFRNSNLKRHTAHANLWCATKWNIQKLESETPHLHLFCVIWNINYRNSENPRSESNQTHTYREDTPSI